ncbi:hypothetical protein ACVIHH_002957 [Bradyrhizobium sp. USDA 4518]
MHLTGAVQVSFPNKETRFRIGKSGNPARRPKGSVSPKAELQKLMDIVLKGEINPLTDLPEDMPAGR